MKIINITVAGIKILHSLLTRRIISKPKAEPIHPVLLKVDNKPIADIKKPISTTRRNLGDIFSLIRKANKNTTVKLIISLVVIGNWKTEGPDQSNLYSPCR